VTTGPPRLPCTHSGSARADVLRGTSARDVLCGLAGKDVIRLGGFDAAYGGAGNDTIYARNGTFDVIVGGPGVDRAQVDPFDQLFGVEKTF
jgi:Ca2+-binding RTX toxin-like protein